MNKIQNFNVLEVILLQTNFLRNENNNNSDQDIEEVPLPAQIEWNSTYDVKEKILKTILKASIGGDESPFTVAVEMGGIFQFNENPKENHIKMLKNVNCPAIIFPYLREYVSDLTKRAGFPPLFLPPFNFVDAYKQKKAKIEQ